ncbi:tetraspanin-8-like [Salvelinus namaycush]|uniref:Tetraspanin n=1 Tax=Salvelinus namaycush TaxID=8040 RepID=A0A8U0U6G5_SALNM|nr:tetraspanin-8-like [Salvelinus namaycush]XP_038840779.1 tetraspanin-8-like [Salvelinus namaycush]
MAVNKCIKYLLFGFNLLLWMSGCIILGVSIYLKVNPVFGGLLPGLNLLIAVGTIVTVLGFLGCFGAIRESRVMLMLFFVGLLLIFVLLAVAGILGAVGVKKIEEWLAEKLLPLRNQSSLFQTFMQNLEERAKCCGLIHGPSDWGSTVPASCDCHDTTRECKLADGQRKVYLRPCIKLVTSVLAKGIFITMGIAFGIAGLMIFGMAFAMTLYCQIGETYATLS